MMDRNNRDGMIATVCFMFGWLLGLITGYFLADLGVFK